MGGNIDFKNCFLDAMFKIKKQPLVLFLYKAINPAQRTLGAVAVIVCSWVILGSRVLVAG